MGVVKLENDKGELRKLIIIRSMLLSAYVSHQGNQSMKGTGVG